MIEEQELFTEPAIMADPLTEIEDLDHSLPILPLKNIVVLPTSIVPIIVGRESSIKAVNYAIEHHNKQIIVSAQKDPDVENPTKNDIHLFGTKAKILQVMKVQNNSLKILVEGVSRVKILDTFKSNDFSSAATKDVPQNTQSSIDIEANWRYLKTTYFAYTKLNLKIPKNLVDHVISLSGQETATDTIAIHTNLSFQDRQKILETEKLDERMMLLIVMLKKDKEILKAEAKIKSRIQGQVEKNQREYYLSEQIKAIHKELGRDDHSNELDKMRQRIKKLQLPKEALERVNKEIERLEQMPAISSESAVSKHYIEWILSIPWNKQSKDSISLSKAKSILNKDHDHLTKVKDRILEFVAAKKYSDKLKKSPTICLTGPPGVGKTSLAESIAKCLGRDFARISLGGVKDEAEIRGHRRTYIGALPGKIIHAMKKVKSINPVILLDEIDKLSSDFSGDPASALLEVLDPEQNKTFVDHFIDTEYDLSNVMFITTSNCLDSIPYALYDRMEIINISGYTEKEKTSIAKNFLIPKQVKEHGLKKNQVKISEEIIGKVINEYTREAGVRQLDRIIAKIMRKAIQEFLNDTSKKTITTTPSKLKAWLGTDIIKKTELNQIKDLPGIATGLAWTELGGEVLEIEINILPGKGNFTLTGQLGEVMQESAQAALSYVRLKALKLGINKSVFNNKDIHIHFPEAATPKDGSSAGITMATALVSALTEIPLKSNYAMTGEVTLRGRVLAIGGLKEKLLAAIQYNVTNVVIPIANKPDLEEFKEDIKDLEFFFAEQMDDVLRYVLSKDPFKKRPKPMKRKKAKIATKSKTKRKIKK